MITLINVCPSFTHISMSEYLHRCREPNLVKLVSTVKYQSWMEIEHLTGLTFAMIAMTVETFKHLPNFLSDVKDQQRTEVFELLQDRMKIVIPNQMVYKYVKDNW